MIIKSLQTQNFKGRSVNHSFELINMITGDNMRGKTAILEAITLGLAGYIPNLGKTPAATFLMSSATNMGVILNLRNGEQDATIQRTWKQSGKSISYVSAWKGIEEDAWEIPPVLIDANEYFSKGGKDRVRMIFSLCAGQGKGTGKKIIAELVKIPIGNAKLQEATPEAQGDLKELMKQMITDVEILEQAAIREELPAQEWIEELIGNCTEKRKAADQNVKRAVSTVEYITETQEIENIPQNVQALLEEKNKTLGDLRLKAAVIEGELQRNGENTLKQSGLEGQRMESENLAKQIQAKEETITPMKREFEEYESNTQRLTETYGTLNKDVEVLNSRINGFVRQLKDLETKFTAEAGKDECPCCGSDGAGWKKSHAKKYDKERKKVEKTRDEAMKTRDGLQATLSEATEALKVSKEQDAKIRLVKSKYDLESHILNQWQNEKARIDKTIAGANGILILEPDTIAAKLEEKLGYEKQIAIVHAEIVELQAKNNKLISFRAGQKQAMEAKRKATKNEMELELYREAVKILEKLQTEMVEETFRGLLVTINKLTGHILPESLAYHDGEIGAWREGRFVSTATFSGTEEALTYAAISIALASKSPIKVLMIDEMGRLTADNKIRLMGAIEKLIGEGVIDQFFGVDVNTDIYNQGAAKLIRV